MAVDRDQKMFIDHCKECLGPNYGKVISLAKRNSEVAAENEPVEHKKLNASKRAGNLTLLSELKKIGCEQWRPAKDGKKPERRHIPKQQLTQSERESIGAKSNNMPKQYQGKILRDAGL